MTRASWPWVGDTNVIKIRRYRPARHGNWRQFPTGTGNSVLCTGLNSDGSSSTLTLNIGVSDTFAGYLDGADNTAFSITKTGAGTLALTNGNNNYGNLVGGTVHPHTTISQGVLSFVSGALGTCQVLLNGGTLQWASGNSQDISNRASNGGLYLDTGATGTLDTNGNNVTLAGTITDFSGSDAGLTKAGAGTLTLSGANTYTGGTTISGGTLNVSGSVGSGPLTVNSAMLEVGEPDAVNTGNFSP